LLDSIDPSDALGAPAELLRILPALNLSAPDSLGPPSEYCEVLAMLSDTLDPLAELCGDPYESPDTGAAEPLP